MKNFFKSLTLTVAIAAASCISAQSQEMDESEEISGGSTISPYQPKKNFVQLVDEKTDIDITKDGYSTTSIFHLHNGGKKCSLPVGFESTHDEYQRFVAYVDEKRVTNIKVTMYTGTDSWDRPINYWREWTLDLEANQTVAIKVSYSAKMVDYESGTRLSFDDQEYRSQAYESFYKMPPEITLAIDGKRRIVDYFLVRSLLWNGPVKNREITMHLGEIEADKVRSINPPATVVTRDQIVWIFKNSPTPLNLKLVLLDSQTHSDLLKRFEILAKKYPNEPVITYTLGDLYGAQGDVLKRLYLYSNFLTSDKSRLCFLWKNRSNAMAHMVDCWRYNAERFHMQSQERELIDAIGTTSKTCLQSNKDDLKYFRPWFDKYSDIKQKRNTK
jgi:hypothetical protein